jgi:N-acetylmuramic acid 6-phosphate etherase
MAERPTEARHPFSDNLHAVPGAEALTRLLDAQAKALEMVRPAILAIEDAARSCAAALRRGGRMAYAGAGSSGTMAFSDALELTGTFGIPPHRTPMLFAGGTDALLHMTGAVEDDPALARADMERAGLTSGDVVICVSASGSTPYTLEVARRAREFGATIVGVANVPGSELLDLSDHAVLLETGPEVVSGSTRMGAGTAAKVALNMLSTRVGLLLGHVHDGYMVNLVADNAKLIDRAAGMVATISGTTPDVAREALARTEGRVKPAVLVAMGATPEAASAALDRAEGHLAKAQLGK